MSWKEIFDIMHPKRNQNNVIQFPTAENKQVRNQKNDLLALTLTIEKLMHQDVWDLAPISDHNMELLGQFGEGLSFKPLTAQRLIANLATELNKYRLQEEEPYK
tara:strand:- start:3668 stop:3979 length:312 start_codon:yes stop_codon:yes gene_type:complete